MQNQSTTSADHARDTASPAASPSHDGTPWGESSVLRRAARRLEIDRDQQLVSKSLVRQASRLLKDEHGSHPEVLIERMEAVLAASRADHQRLSNARINLRVARDAWFADSVPVPAALAVYGHRGNYHGVHASMPALGLMLGHLVGHPEGEAVDSTAASLAEELHRRGEIWTLERDGVVHVFARPDSDADQILAGSATRVPRTLAPTQPARLVVLS
jgi:hypothetical protein